jgi:hypothetical protein
MSSCYEPTAADIGEALADLEAFINQLPEDNRPGTYADDIATVLESRPMIRMDAINALKSRRTVRGCYIPATFEECVQRAFNIHNNRSTSKDRDEGALIFTTFIKDGETYWAMAAYRLR